MKIAHCALFAALVFNVLSASATAASAVAVSVSTLGTYGRHQIRVDQTEVTLVFNTVFRTCQENRGHLRGDVKKVEVPSGTYTSVQQVIADLAIFTPLMICRTAEQDFNVSREVTFKSLPNMKFINLDIWVPSDITISVK